ncbi:MAG: CoA-acylating methylmalonate-semialdehyde dehydrogenase [Gammaproteobacteria bacterium]|nr:CoA-acylating methylmalonate-semialdehyde dehydrogenase [Gammaproteobacteria bacterium]
MVEAVPHVIGGEFVVPTTGPFLEVNNPATGGVIAKVPVADKALCDSAVDVATDAFQKWSNLPPIKRVQVLFKFRTLLEEHQAELAALMTREHGKTLDDAKGSILRAIEVVELHCGVLTALQGDFSGNVASSIDCWTMREPLGVCAGVSPFNFPVMVPTWMMIPAIAAGNAFILKPSEQVPSAANYLLKLLNEAGLPPGVVQVLHGDKTTVDHLLAHPGISAFTAVASTPVAEAIYVEATRSGKRAHTFGSAKNHAVVMPDADLTQTIPALIGAAFGSAGERCMAISVVVAVGDDIANILVNQLKSDIGAIRVDVGDAADVDMGPLINEAAHTRVLEAITGGVAAGADLVVDGREFKHAEYPAGFFVGPSLFDHVTESMDIYQREIFGPVLVVLRVQDFEEALALVNRNPYGNGTAIFTRSGYYAREYSRRVQVGMVGVNIPIPVPIATHPFGGWKRSAFGDTNMHGAESIHFYTRRKTVTTRWPLANQEEAGSFSMPTH